ncbi:LOW QUALITY PROTEIN: hypothetical protein HID58_007906 [Brassica napus]|uniref:Response regulatory domain-containing protein n=1 Tax=Brassica napus TaxID=3708 RepID=A0ABQ7XHW6_BRANA|nr:LOW QUALITY PROTEIN: hypothetical protein HID58_007906 [Brassica napus]
MKNFEEDLKKKRESLLYHHLHESTLAATVTPLPSPPSQETPLSPDSSTSLPEQSTFAAIRLASSPHLLCSSSTMSTEEQRRVGSVEKEVKLNVRLNHQVKFGEHVAIFGSAEEMAHGRRSLLSLGLKLDGFASFTSTETRLWSLSSSLRRLVRERVVRTVRSFGRVRWLGSGKGKASFMSSNEHGDREVGRSWDTMVLKVRVSRWWKLGVLRGRKVEGAYILCSWINTGQIHVLKMEGITVRTGMLRSPGLYSEVLVARKIHLCLPSFKAEFTASVPLTRIRDIAHQIKHTIQNKLHRNAGPEDLIATEAMLERITEPRKIQWRLCGAFLWMREVFLLSLCFLNVKRLDASGESSNVLELIKTMHSLASLRETIVKELNSGLRNDAPDAAIAMRQKWRLCEIGLEDYFFVLLSRCGIKRLSSWNDPLDALVLGVHQVGLSGWKQEECLAIGNELLAWRERDLLEKEDIRKSSRDSREQCQDLYRSRDSCGISKLCTVLLKAKHLGSEGWDVIVPGSTSGTLVQHCARSLPSTDGGPVILLVNKADGDEEVSAANGNIAGVMLLQELPHLRKSSFVTCDDDEKVAEIRRLVGNILEASPSNVNLILSTEDNKRTDKKSVSVDDEESKPVSSSSNRLLYSHPSAQRTRSSSIIQGSNRSCHTFWLNGVSFKAKQLRRKKKLETATPQDGELDSICDQIHKVMESLQVPKETINSISKAFPKTLVSLFVLAPTWNVSSRLYESIPNVSPSDPSVFSASFWASLYTRRAVLSRRAAGVSQIEASMAVLVQEMLSPDLSSFSTRETLASGTRGTPWRLASGKLDGIVQTLAFANFSEELLVSGKGPADGKYVRLTVDYSKKRLTVDSVFRQRLGQRLGSVGFFLKETLVVHKTLKVVWLVKMLHCSVKATTSMAGEVPNLEASKLTALVVDDNFCPSKLLDRLGLKTTSYLTAKKPLTFFFRQNYDLILMDMDMPIMNGIQATRRLREMGIESKIAGVTTRAEEEEVKEFMEAGLNDFQEKPLTISKLVSILHNLELYVQT